MGDIRGRQEVVVLGAGITGLQTALFLLEAGVGVTLVAKHWPEDRDIGYTSPWAGAQWRSNIDLNDLKRQEWDKQTYLYWMEVVKRYSPEECGLESTSPEANIWWSSFIPDLRVLPPSSLPSNAGFTSGLSYTSFCLSPPRYLHHLLALCISLGARTHTANVTSLPELFRIPSCEFARGVVNCTGLSALSLVGDQAVFPTKGQTVLVKGQARQIRVGSGTGSESEALVIPQPGSNVTFLGGCKLAGDWSTTIDDEMTKTILRRCRPMAPELLNANGEFDILSVQIGRRPSRKGGARVELEWLEIGREKKFVCHNYGHCASGYENSVGTAREAVKLVLDCISSPKNAVLLSKLC